jgi:hypothetical protein
MSCDSVRPSTRTGTSTFAVYARGILLTNQIAARHFGTKGAGCIVNTASRNVSPQRVIDDLSGANAARTARRAGGRRRRGGVPMLGAGAVHDRAGDQCHRRGLYDLVSATNSTPIGHRSELYRFVGAVSGKVINIGKTKAATTAIIAPGTIIQPVRSVRRWAT